MITVTDLANKKIVALLKKRGKGVGIRIGVKTTGCSGLAYVLEYVDEFITDPEYISYPQKSIDNNNKFIIVYIDKKSQVYLNDLTIDWVRNGLNEGFEFKNPNERDRCGCGESFRV